MHIRRYFRLLVPFALVTAGHVRAVRADDIAACASAHLAAQELRDAAKLRAARTKLVACSRSACPTPIRVQCDGWLTELDARMPTVVLGAQDAAGHEVTDMRVSLDGSPFLASLDGKAVPVDPGAHVLQFERAGSAPLEERVVVREGEKNRPVIVRLPAPKGNGSTKPASPERSAPPLLAYVLGGLGVASLAGFAVVGLGNQSTFDDCRDHGCPSSTKDRLAVEQQVARALLGVGIVSLGVATWLFLSPGHGAPSATVALRSRVLPGGGGLELGAHF